MLIENGIIIALSCKLDIASVKKLYLLSILDKGIVVSSRCLPTVHYNSNQFIVALVVSYNFHWLLHSAIIAVAIATVFELVSFLSCYPFSCVWFHIKYKGELEKHHTQSVLVICVDFGVIALVLWWVSLDRMLYVLVKMMMGGMQRV